MQEERDLETKAMSEELDKRDEEIQRLELLLDTELKSKDREIQQLRDQLASEHLKSKPKREPTAEEISEREEALAEEKREAESDVVSFYFIAAEKLRETSESSLPCFQALQERDGWVHKLEMVSSSAYRHRYVKEYLAVSHRWELWNIPDSQGKQLAQIIAYLKKNPHIKWVWYDFWCMPQVFEDKDRSPAEDVRFKWMLKNVNLLYLGCSVLLMVDVTYTSRFWVSLR